MQNAPLRLASLVAIAALSCSQIAAPVLASTLEVQQTTVHSGEYAASLGVTNNCEFPDHTALTDPIVAGQYSACSTLTANTDLASGDTSFTAGDLIVLKEGFQVLSGASLNIEIDRDLYPDAWVQDDTPDGETIYSARFYIDPTDLTLGEEVSFFNFLAFDSGGKQIFRVGIKQPLTEKLVFLEVFDDEGSIVSTELEPLVLPPLSGWHWIDVGWQAATDGVDGSAIICFGTDAPPIGCVNLSSLDNDTGAIDFVRWGAMEVPFGEHGVIDIDDFQSGPFLDGFESGNTSAWSTTSVD